jgi:hypothetical protein
MSWYNTSIPGKYPWQYAARISLLPVYSTPSCPLIPLNVSIDYLALNRLVRPNPVRSPQLGVLRQQCTPDSA